MFGEKVYKISLHIDVSCPNRDGKLGSDGCIFCNPLSLNPEARANMGDIMEQLKEGINYVKKRHGAHKFISYFQQHTNTYGNIAFLKKCFLDAIGHPDIVGAAISTRPDCIDNDILNLLSHLNEKTYLWTELGVQSADDNMLTFLNRGHTVDDFITAANLLRQRNIDVVAHVIIGLPNETQDDILKTAKLLNETGVRGVKIHNLHILKGTRLETLHNEGKVELISQEEYAKRVVFMVENLNTDIVIHRFNSHAPRRLTIAPDWSINKLATFNAVEDELEKQDTWQGKTLVSREHQTD